MKVIVEPSPKIPIRGFLSTPITKPTRLELTDAQVKRALTADAKVFVEKTDGGKTPITLIGGALVFGKDPHTIANNIITKNDDKKNNEKAKEIAEKAEQERLTREAEKKAKAEKAAKEAEEKAKAEEAARKKEEERLAKEAAEKAEAEKAAKEAEELAELERMIAEEEAEKAESENDSEEEEA